MRILIIGPAYPLRGGLSVIDEAMCRAFLKEGHEAAIVTYKLQYPGFLFPGKTQMADGPPPDGLEIHVWMNSINPLNWVSTACKINCLKPDLLIFRNWIPFMGPCFGTIVRFLKKSITVLAVVDNLYPHEKRPGDRLLTNYFLRKIDGYITFSKTVLRQLEENGFKNIIYTPHPLDDNLGERVTKREACHRLGLDPAQHYVLFFGFVRRYKGLDLLLESFARPEVQSLGLKLLVVGEFYDDKEKYMKIIEENGLQDTVRVIDAFVPVPEVRYYFSAADLVTQTYHSASQSGITQIAYHFEKPMLVTNVGGLREYVPHGKVGYVVEKDPKAIAAAIADFFTRNRGPEFEPHIREEKKKYSWEIFVKNVLGLYERVRK
ncbi:MAG TPA: glycosyltransferase [Bacteroidetes bacterium]|nr:glycosyltransferase [Bacteroidota bacterium]